MPKEKNQKNMEIAVISSLGPMASTNIAALLEKFGFLNIPVRKLELSKYLLNKIDIDNLLMKERIREVIINDSKKQKKGGFSKYDNTQKSVTLTNFNLIEKEYRDYLKKDYTKISELYSDAKNLYAKSLIYKNTEHQNNMHIELLTGRDYIEDPEELYKMYNKNFGKVFFVHLHRPFGYWCNSLASQSFYKSGLLSSMQTYRIDKVKAKYDNYEKFVSRIPGLNISFDEIFNPNTKKLIFKLSKFIRKPIPKLKFENEKYDLYGGLRTYEQAFTKFDDDQRYLSKSTISLIDNYYKKKKVNFFHDTVSTFCYLKDLLSFKINSLKYFDK